MNDIERKLQQASDAVTERMLDVVQKQTLKVQANAKNLCPVRRYGTGGSLRQSIMVSVGKTETGVEGVVYTNSEYAPYVEFGTGPVGQANHTGTSPEVNPVYSQSGWVIPADAMSVEDAEAYGFGVARDGDEVIGYYTKGQVAQPFMYPALNDYRDEIAEGIKKELIASLKRVK